MKNNIFSTQLNVKQNDIAPDIKEYKYDTVTYIIEKMKIDKHYVNSVFDFYKKSIANYAMSNNTNNISGYRKKLISLSKNELKINDFGHIYEENCQNPYLLQQSVNNMLIYMFLQYEEDSRIEKYDEIYDFESFPISEFNSEIKKIKSRKYEKFADKFDNYKWLSPEKAEKQDSIENVLININGEIIYEYNYKEQRTYVCLADWNGNKFPLKISVALYDPVIDIVDHKIKNKNCKIKIIKNKPLTIFSTLNNTKVFKPENQTWVFE